MFLTIIIVGSKAKCINMGCILYIDVDDDAKGGHILIKLTDGSEYHYTTNKTNNPDGYTVLTTENYKDIVRQIVK